MPLQAAAVLICAAALTAQAQVMGEEAELERLAAKAEDAIAGGDPEAAAMNSGRAALMAAQLAARQTVPSLGQMFKGAEALFRGQEHAYRAMALFQRAGGELPASSGVCRTMGLAGEWVRRAEALLAIDVTTLPTADRIRQTQQWHDAAAGWTGMVEGMTTDFQCQ